MKTVASIYVGLDDYPYQKNIEYLHNLSNIGIKRIFISAHMPEVKDTFLEELIGLIDEANKLNMEIILDISKPSLEKIGIIGNIYSLRLDWGFSNDDIIELRNYPFLLELNASTITQSALEDLKSRGLDFNKLRVSHNFYPKPYTGLSYEAVLEKNKLFRSYGMHIMIYIPSSVGKRPPLYEGLPTIEEHRNLDLDSILADMTLLDVDEVCFGDAYASNEELEAAINFDLEIINIPIYIYDSICDTEKEILNKIHRNRADQSIYFIRSSHREINEITPFNTINRSKYSITIDNREFLRYQGEVAIMRMDLEKDHRVNVVGKALISDFLLQNMKPRQKFRFRIRGTINE